MMSYAESFDDVGLRPAFELWMAGIVTDPGSHLRFANTLSMLEHIGSVKIARTQAGESITGETLQHLAEETRHAQVLKKIVHGIDPDAAPDYADRWLMAGASARAYFARLDAGVRAFVRDRFSEAIAGRAAYLLVTWLVEMRASWLYPAYQGALKEGGLRFSVRSIIGEEERHLADITDGMAELGIASHPDLPALVAHEAGLFRRLAVGMMGGENSKFRMQNSKGG